MLYLSPLRKANSHIVLEKIQNTATLTYPRRFHVRRARLPRRDNMLYYSGYYWWKKGGNEQQKLDHAVQLYQQLRQKLPRTHLNLLRSTRTVHHAANSQPQRSFQQPTNSVGKIIHSWSFSCSNRAKITICFSIMFLEKEVLERLKVYKDPGVYSHNMGPQVWAGIPSRATHSSLLIYFALQS